jgi:tRNA threonylcarbamoyladenosine biosynthesis protein TsaB
MYLALATASDTTLLILLTKNHDELEYYLWESGRSLAERLLEEIKSLLMRNDCKWEQIEGLIYYEGPGSFTGLRIGATVANTIAYVRKVPIVGTRGDAWVPDGIKRLAQGENAKQVTPFYDREPNITKPGRKNP